MSVIGRPLSGKEWRCVAEMRSFSPEWLATKDGPCLTLYTARTKVSTSETNAKMNEKISDGQLICVCVGVSLLYAPDAVPPGRFGVAHAWRASYEERGRWQVASCRGAAYP